MTNLADRDRQSRSKPDRAQASERFVLRGPPGSSAAEAVLTAFNAGRVRGRLRLLAAAGAAPDGVGRARDARGTEEGAAPTAATSRNRARSRGL